MVGIGIGGLDQDGQAGGVERGCEIQDLTALRGHGQISRDEISFLKINPIYLREKWLFFELTLSTTMPTIPDHFPVLESKAPYLKSSGDTIW